MQVESREYKVIVDTTTFADLSTGLSNILDDVKDVANSLRFDVSDTFDLDKPKERTILFLDTPDFTLRTSGLLLRQRVNQKEDGKTEYTLKCRTEDRYIAAGQVRDEKSGMKSKSKFEEDIACPFVSRFSHSAIVSFDDGDELAGDQFPNTLAAAASLFPQLAELKHDEMLCSSQTVLRPVNERQVWEQVFTGPEVQFPRGNGSSSVMPAEIALILWSKVKPDRSKREGGRLLTAELSFRYEDENESFSIDVAKAAKQFFARLQCCDWARPDGSTKTEYMYGCT